MKITAIENYQDFKSIVDWKSKEFNFCGAARFAMSKLK
jgi:hypothetical protein